ncbi:E3 ubiquitin-protein ligase TRIM71-like [Oopsacas minuta]|uniref:E3 ubiquitin-protein ligase TRIM71-like n=1 Tax=Oopsacas minuta TaxID=111878 RepID=A0AAV7JK31_9METZ|nr:E3 ubiquitin-protein ligase TRIM71-like [Oopsacas minuta]
MNLETIKGRLKDLRTNISMNFKILHSKLDEYEQLIGEELDRLLNGVIQQATTPNSDSRDVEWKIELQELGQTRGSLFNETNGKLGEVEVLGDIRLNWNQIEFDNAMQNMCVIDNSLKVKEVEEFSPFTGCREGHLPGELHGPRGLSVDILDNIYISDQYNKRIQIFSKNGEYLQHFGDEHLTGPWSVAVIGDNAYVTDAGQHSVFWFKISESKLVKKSGGKGTGNGQFNVPHGIDGGGDDLIYICDCFNNRITVLDQQLDFVKQQCELQVMRPDDVIVKDNMIFVLDSNDPCFHAFNIDGVKVFSIIHGVNDNEPHMTKWGYFFAINWEKGLVLISDAVNHCLRIFSLKGELVQTLGQVGIDKGEFMTPQGVGIMSDKRVVTVCLDKKSDMLQIF